MIHAVISKELINIARVDVRETDRINNNNNNNQNNSYGTALITHISFALEIIFIGMTHAELSRTCRRHALGRIWSCKYSQCVYRLLRCSSSIPAPQYSAHYRIACYSNNLYWYDSLGKVNSLYKNCPDMQ